MKLPVKASSFCSVRLRVAPQTRTAEVLQAHEGHIVDLKEQIKLCATGWRVGKIALLAAPTQAVPNTSQARRVVYG